MSGDMIHTGHVNILKVCKSLCQTLIVGLTTDTLATKQKRKPWIKYRDRKSVIEALEYVDAVVEHNGQSKQEAYRRLEKLWLRWGDTRHCHRNQRQDERDASGSRSASAATHR